MKRLETISTRNLAIGYGEKKVLEHLNLQLNIGELTCLLGPNGSGKSTLIRSLTAVQQPLEGSVTLKGREVFTYQRKDLAKELSLVLTENHAPANLSVFALVALGRFPYTSWLGQLTKQDEAVINWALKAAGVEKFAARNMGELSDGEKQKVMIARALAQETDVLILDEPTAHLDSPNRIEIFHLLQDLALNHDKAILISTHDIETALGYSNRLWLVEQDQIEVGLPEDLVIQGHLENAFKTDRIHFDYGKGIFSRTKTQATKPIGIKGDPHLCFWLRQALERNGYEITEPATTTIEAGGTLKTPEMRIAGESKSYKTIEELLIVLKNEEN